MSSLFFRRILVLVFILSSKEYVKAMDSEFIEEPHPSVFRSLTNIDRSRNQEITQMDLSFDDDLHDISFIRFFPNLRELDVSNSALRNHYQPIAQLTHLERLDLWGTRLTTAKHLISLINLKFLSISVPDIGRSVQYLKKLPKLDELDISGGTKNIHKLSRLTNLKKLKLSGVFNKYRDEDDDLEFPPLNFLSFLKELRVLDISINDYIFYIKPITKLPHLKILNLSGNKNIRDLQRLKTVKSLIKLRLNYLSSESIPTLTEDLKAIATLPHLKVLFLSSYVEPPEFPETVTIRYTE